MDMKGGLPGKESVLQPYFSPKRQQRLWGYCHNCYNFESTREEERGIWGATLILPRGLTSDHFSQMQPPCFTDLFFQDLVSKESRRERSRVQL